MSTFTLSVVDKVNLQLQTARIGISVATITLPPDNFKPVSAMGKSLVSDKKQTVKTKYGK